MRSESCSFIWHPNVRAKYRRATGRGYREPGGHSVVETNRLIEVDRWHGLGRGLRLGDHLGTDALGDLHHDLGILGEEVLRVLTTLTQLLAVVGEPRAGLLDELELHAHVEQRTFAADALAVHDVELALPERRSDLVLHHLHTRAVADHLDAVLDRLDAPDVEPHGRIEL